VIKYHNAFLIFSKFKSTTNYAVLFLPNKEIKRSITDENKNTFGITAVADKV
jgi:hypothetical protein